MAVRVIRCQFQGIPTVRRREVCLHVTSSSAKTAAVVAAFAAAVLSAQSSDLKITGGLFDYQVVPRESSGRGVTPASGAASTKFNNRYIEARVLDKAGAEMPGLTGLPLSQIKNGKWSGTISGLPTGGPYQIEVRVSGVPNVKDSVSNVWVGDLWVLAGQSNMEGVGDLVNLTQPIDPVHSFDMADRWGIAVDPLHTLPTAIDKVHWRKNKQGELERLTGPEAEAFVSNRKKGAGLGLPFAIEMYRRTGVPVGLVPCAHGGTSMDQWSPALKAEGGGSLYGATIRRIGAVGGRIKGILWYQGESDASAKDAPGYQQKFEKLIEAFRADTGQPDLPFYFVQIGRHVNNGGQAEWNHVQEMERQIELKVPHTGMVASIDVELDDPIHVSTDDQKRIGRRLAALAAHDLYPDSSKDNAAVKRGPRPVSARLDKQVIKVTLSEVNGRLSSDGRIAGFAIVNPAGQVLPAIYKARFDPNDGSVIYLQVQGEIPAGSALRYGVGRNPYCNVRDTADMALPAFGPMPIDGTAPAAALPSPAK
jgi:sialate O-acetylesterase